MTIRDIIESEKFRLICEGDEPDREIETVFCCDLLSVAMSKGPEGAAWVSVMGNINALAVMSLTDMACLILAEGARLDEQAVAKAKEEGLAVFATDGPIFETALEIREMMN